LPVLAHEIAHQWFGDSVSPATWREIWLSEAWAMWWEWYWSNKQNGEPTTVEEQFTTNFNSTTEPTRWNTPPANLGNASEMFSEFPVYTRPAIMLEAYRQITSDSTFFALQRALVTDYAYSSISTLQFIQLAKRIAQERSQFEESYIAKLDEFFQQWLYGVGKPTLTPTTFSPVPPLSIRPAGTNDLEITWSATSPELVLESSEDLG